MPIALFVLVIIPIAAWAQFAPHLLRTVLLLILPIAVSLALVQGLFYPGAASVLVQFGPIALKTEGLVFAFVTATRLLVIAGAGLLVVYSTPPSDLALAMVQSGAPTSLAFITVSAIQLVPEMQSRAAAILTAQQARGLETQGNLLVRIRAFLPLVAPLIYGALEGVQERALALDARAFRAPRPKTSWRELRDTRGQWVFRIVLILSAISIVIAAFAFGI